MEEKISLLDYFDRGFLEEAEVVSAVRQNKFYSKKNRVNSVDIVFRDRSNKTYVIKEYTGVDRYIRSRNESFFYDVLKNSYLRIPGIFYRKEGFLIMEFLGNETLLDYITLMEKADNQISMEVCSSPESFMRIYRPLADACFYINNFNKTLENTTGRSFVLNDMNLRNFLLPGNEIHRVDFEDCCEGKVEEDFGKFIAFLLTYRPSFTGWKMMVSECIKKICADLMALDLSRINFEVEQEFERMKKRRMH